MSKKIVVKTPLRVSFVGGGTDIPFYYEQFGGEVLSTAINKYVTVEVSPNEYGDISVVTGDDEYFAEDSMDLDFPLVSVCMEKVGVYSGVDIVIKSDVTSHGSGLGASSALIVGLLRALNLYKGVICTDLDMACVASDIEINILGKPIGKQDQYICALGGFRDITFNFDGTVDPSVLVLPRGVLDDFQDSLILVDTGTYLSSDNILKKVQSNCVDKDVIGNLHAIKDMVKPFYQSLNWGNFSGCGRILSVCWDFKRSLADSVSTDYLDTIYDNVMRLGAFGGKLLGAGGGGHFLFCVPKKSRRDIEMYLDIEGLSFFGLKFV